MVTKINENEAFLSFNQTKRCDLGQGFVKVQRKPLKGEWVGSTLKRGDMLCDHRSCPRMISRIAVAVAAIWSVELVPLRRATAASLTTIQAIIGPPDGSSGFCQIY